MDVDESVPTVATEGSPEEIAAELERVKAENERLKAMAQGKPPTSRHTWRWIAAIALMVVGLILFALAVPTVWINRTIMDTDQWVATVGPLAQNAAIQDTIAEKVSTALFAKVDIEAQIRSLLPTALAPIAAPVAGQVQTYADRLIVEVVRSDQFSNIWIETMRATQQAFVAAIEGGREGGAVSTTNGEITLNTDAFVSAAQERLASTRIAGLSKYVPWDKFPDSFVLYDSPRLAQAQNVFGLFNSVVWILPFLALLCLGLALWVAPNTRRAWLWVGIGIVVVTLVPFEALVFGRTAFINAAYNTAQIPTDAAQAFWDIVFKFLVTMQTTAITVGIVIAAIAFFAGPSGLALWFRHGVERTISLARGNTTFGAFGEFVAENKSALRVGAVALGVVIDVLAAPLTPRFVIGTAVFVGILVLIIEFFGQTTRIPLPVAGSSSDVGQAPPM